MRKKKLDIIRQEKMVVIIRLKEQAGVAPVVESLVTAGVRTLEITSNTPGFLHEIADARNRYPEILVGAGTVTSIAIAKDAIHAGAQFLVTPHTHAHIIAVAHQHDIPVIMGALTPTEIALAVESGADIVKLFPAGALGLTYFKAIKAVFNTVDFFTVGGMHPDNIQDWMKAGALGIGVAGNLVKPVKNQKDRDVMIKRTHQFIKCLKTG